MIQINYQEFKIYMYPSHREAMLTWMAIRYKIGGNRLQILQILTGANSDH